MTSPEQLDENIEAFRKARSWEVTAGLVASETMYVIAQSVIAGDISSREAAKRMGITRSSMARFVDKVKEGGGEVKVDDAMDEAAYSHIIWVAMGRPDADAPFVVTVDEDGTRRVAWA